MVRLMSENWFKSYICVREKARYSRGLDRPKVDCLLCAMARGDKAIETRVIFQNETGMVVLNRFPYNAGHLMVFPKKHVEKFTDLDDEALAALFRLVQKSAVLVEKTYNPSGLNIGINQGRAAGASVAHVHVHIVPRYEGEAGFMEVLAATRVIHENLDDSLNRLLSNLDVMKDGE
jgi:ATP adenylyltransferase